MSAFDQILSASYRHFNQLLYAVEEAAKVDGFVVNKKNVDYSKESRTVVKGSFRCYKSGKSKAQSGRTSKCDCPFQLNFRLNTNTEAYTFTPTRILEHNHPLKPETTTMTAKARRFTTAQLDQINSLHALKVPVPLIMEELKKNTTTIIQDRDIYNALQTSQKNCVDGLSQVQGLIDALDKNPEFIYDVGGDAENQMLWLTFASRRSLAQFRSMSFVLLMDATYKTNRFNLPLLIISSIDAFGKSYIVACSLLRHETAASYGYALVSFKSLFESHVPFVHTVVTDQEKALMNAICCRVSRSLSTTMLVALGSQCSKEFCKEPFTLFEIHAFCKGPHDGSC